MTVELTEAQKKVLEDLKPATSAEELHALLAKAEQWYHLVKEVMEPDQSVNDTRAEAQDLYLQLVADAVALALVNFTEEHRARFRDVVRALLTVEGIFSQQLRLGDYRVLSVEKVLQESLPWRGKLRVAATQAFFFDEESKATYQDHNQTGTVEEEEADLEMLVAAAKRDAAELALVGFTAEDILTGERLLAQAQGRDISGIIGVRNQAEMKQLRDRLLTLAVILARHARAAAANAFHGKSEKAERYMRANFHKALRRIRPARSAVTDAPVPAPQPEPVPA